MNQIALTSGLMNKFKRKLQRAFFFKKKKVMNLQPTKFGGEMKLSDSNIAAMALKTPKIFAAG